MGQSLSSASSLCFLGIVGKELGSGSGIPRNGLEESVVLRNTHIRHLLPASCRLNTLVPKHGSIHSASSEALATPPLDHGTPHRPSLCRLRKQGSLPSSDASHLQTATCCVRKCQRLLLQSPLMGCYGQPGNSANPCARSSKSFCLLGINSHCVDDQSAFMSFCMTFLTSTPAFVEPESKATKQSLFDSENCAKTFAAACLMEAN